MEAMRTRWADDRIDDLKERVDSGFAEVDKRFDRVESKIQSQGEELRAEIDKRFDMIERRFNVLLGSIATGVVGLVVSNLVS